MQDIKEKLIITKEKIEGEEYIRLNLSLKTLCKLMKTAGFKVFKKLKEEGIDIDCPVLISQKDMDDYHHYQEMHKDSYPFEQLTPEEKFEEDVNHLISNSTYFDIPFTGIDRKIGLKDTLGNIVVPPLFDKAEGTDYLFYDRIMARVWKEDKIWLSPRDGSGRIIGKGYDSVIPYFSNAYVKRSGKSGFIDLETGEEMIPSEMDWLQQVVSDYIFTKNGKMGYFFYYDEFNRYIEPQFDAINLTTHQLLKNGEWGWLSEWGEFVTCLPKHRDETKELIWHLDHYIEEDPDAEKKYYTIDEVFNMEDRLSAMIRERNRTLKSYLTLPQIKFQYGYKPLSKVKMILKESIEKIVSEPAKIINLCFTDNENKHPGFKVIVKNKDGKPEIDFYMEASNNDEFWKIIKIPEKILKSFHVILSAPDNKFNIKITRNFKNYEVSMLAKFITFYFTEILNLRNEDIRIDIR